MTTLEKLIDECNIIEYKEEISEGLFKSISALSNTDGGCILLGVGDDKNIKGIDLSNGNQERIINRLVDLTGIQPIVDVIYVEDKTILKIMVEKSSVPIAYKNDYYKRVGNTTRKANKEELKKLLLKDNSWDSITTDRFTLEDINPQTVTKFLELAIAKERLPIDARSLNLEQLLTQLELLRDGKLTNGAILLFGKNPQKLLPTATIRIGLFKGNDESVIISDKNITGNLFEQIDDVDSALKLFTNMRAEIKGFQREDIWDYPLPALREAVLNAIIHKDYFDYSSAIQIKVFGDNIWFYNSGDLFGGLTIEKLKEFHVSKSRNPLIMKVIHMAGYVEQFGTGTNRIISSCLKQGIPAPKFEVSQGGFILQMYKQYQGTNERQNKAIQYVVENETISNSEYQELNGCSRDISKRELKTLLERGIFITEGINKSLKYRLRIK